MRRLAVVLLIPLLATPLAACGGGDKDDATAAPTPTESSSGSPAFPTVDPQATAPTVSVQESALDVARAKLRELNTGHYVTELRSSSGAVDREEGDFQISPLGATMTRVVGDEPPVQFVGTAHEYWSRKGSGCWEHPAPIDGDYILPSGIDVLLRAVWRNDSPGQLLISAAVPAVISGVDPELFAAIGVPDDPPYGLVEVRVTIDGRGVPTGWETTLAELVAAVERAGGSPDPRLHKIDATLRATLTNLGSDIDLDPPRRCRGVHWHFRLTQVVHDVRHEVPPRAVVRRAAGPGVRDAGRPGVPSSGRARRWR